MDPFSLLLDSLNSLITTSIKALMTFLQALLIKPPSLPTGNWEQALEAEGWGFYQILAAAVIVLVLITLPFMIFGRKVGAGIKTVVFGFVSILIGSAFFYEILDKFQSISTSLDLWLLGPDPTGNILEFSPGSLPTLLLNSITLVVSGYYVIAIMLLFYAFMLLMPIFKLLIFPLGLLMHWFKWAKWMFDWLLTIGILGLFLGAPIVIGIISLAKYANQALNVASPFGAALALLAGLVIAKRYLYSATNGLHRTISQHTEEMQSNVRGQVETDWKDRPQLDVAAASAQYANVAVPPPKEPSLTRRVIHGTEAAGFGLAAAEVAGSAVPGGVFVVAGLEVIQHHHRRQAGLPSGKSTSTLKEVGDNVRDTVADQTRRPTVPNSTR